MFSTYSKNSRTKPQLNFQRANWERLTPIPSEIYAYKLQTMRNMLRMYLHVCHVSHEKTTLLLSIESWLFHSDPGSL